MATARGQHQHSLSCQRSADTEPGRASLSIDWRSAQTVAVDWRTPLPAQRHPLVSALDGSCWPFRSRAIAAQRALLVVRRKEGGIRTAAALPAPFFDGVPRCGRASLRGICGHRSAAAARRCAEPSALVIEPSSAAFAAARAGTTG